MKALGWSVLLLLLTPFIILVCYAKAWSVPSPSIYLPVLAFTVLQAGVSAILSLVLGVVGALGLLSLTDGKAQKFARLFVLVPNVVPTLMVILASMNVWQAGRGLGAIVFVHVILNAGLVATVVAGLISSKLGSMAELAHVEGASRTRFLSKVVIPLLRNDLLRIGLFVFTLCMASFAVPLVLGGSRATTMEVLIYERIRLSLDWSQALGLAGLQTMVVLILAWFLRSHNEEQMRNVSSLPLVGWAPGLHAIFFPSMIVVFGLMMRLPQAYTEMKSISGFAGDWSRLVLGSFIVSFVTGLLTAFLLLILLYVRPQGTLRRLLLGYVAPSSVLVGFSILLLWRTGGVASLVKIAIGLTLITVPAFYRLYWDATISSLTTQASVARTLGASTWKTMWSILVPQTWEQCMFLAGLAAFWAWGDFALSAVIGENTLTLAMLTHALASSYRLASATALAWILILGGSLTFLIFWGAGRVYSTRSRS